MDESMPLKRFVLSLNSWDSSVIIEGVNFNASTHAINQLKLML